MKHTIVTAADFTQRVELGLLSIVYGIEQSQFKNIGDRVAFPTIVIPPRIPLVEALAYAEQNRLIFDNRAYIGLSARREPSGVVVPYGLLQSCYFDTAPYFPIYRPPTDTEVERAQLVKALSHNITIIEE